MSEINCFIFDLYNTIIDDELTFLERERYRLDTIYTILEKYCYPVKFPKLQSVYNDMIDYMGEYHIVYRKAFTPFYQVDYLLKKLSIDDFIVFKKIYDVYTEAILQIPPKLMYNAEKALKYIKERGIKIGLITNTGRTPGDKLRMLLKDLKILQFFDGLFFSDEVGFLKPHPEIFNNCLRWLDVEKSKCLFIGDTYYSDYYGAIGVGMKAYLYKKGEDDLYQISLKYIEK